MEFPRPRLGTGDGDRRLVSMTESDACDSGDSSGTCIVDLWDGCDRAGAGGGGVTSRRRVPPPDPEAAPTLLGRR